MDVQCAKTPPISKWEMIVVVVLAGSHWCLLCILASLYSPTIDEPAHLAAGYRIIDSGRFDVYIVNPPFVKIIAALPLLYWQPKVDWSQLVLAPGYREEFSVGSRLFHDNSEIWSQMMVSSRICCTCFSVLGCIIAWWWSRQAFGQLSGFVALLLWCCDPNILGNGCLITPDLPGGVFGLAASYVYWKGTICSRWRYCLGAGVLLGLAVLCKSTMLLLFGAWGGWLVIAAFASRDRLIEKCVQLLTSGLVCIYVVNVGYGFSGTGKPLGEYRFVSSMMAGDLPPGVLWGNRVDNSIIGSLPVLLPEPFLSGLDLQKKDFEKGRWSFVDGRYTWRGHPTFYIIAMLIKSPILYPLLFLLATGLVASVRSRREAEGICLSCCAVIIVIVSCESGFRCFSRYTLPALPVAIVYMSSAVRQCFDNNRKWQRMQYAVATIAFVSSAVNVSHFPHFLSYCNEAWGGPENCYRVLSDSNVDWGQDLRLVREWINNHPRHRPVTLAWNPFFDPRLAGVELPQTPLSRQSKEEMVSPGRYVGWHIVCASALNAADQRYAYLRDIPPADRIGYSVLVFSLDEEQAGTASAEIWPPLSQNQGH